MPVCDSDFGVIIVLNFLNGSWESMNLKSPQTIKCTVDLIYCDNVTRSQLVYSYT